MRDDSFSWMIGGPQGSGVDSSANILARACAHGGLWVFGKREYHSNIMGLHSYFQVRVSKDEIRSPVDRVDLLATFEEETLVRHAAQVVPGGGILYDPAKAAKPIAEIETWHGYAKEHLLERLQQGGYEPTVAGVLKEAEARGVQRFPIPYTDLLNQLAAHYPEKQLSKLTRVVNVVAVAASLALVKFDGAPLEEAVRAIFGKKAEIAEINVFVADRTVEYTAQHFPRGLGRTLTPRPSGKRLFLMGNQAVALGKLLGGCRMQTYYPITPASDESEFLEAHEVFDAVPEAKLPDNQGSILVVQTEDEIAAITMATGAALAGTRAATSTSGPGFSLMCEGLGFAGINEVPVVVTLYQRAGPSTGMPTRHEQGDLRFAMHSGQGEFPRIVLASGDMEECIYDAARCMDYAERYQLPVIHLVDKALANSNSLVPIPDPKRIHIERGALVSSVSSAPGAPYKRFAQTADGLSPRAPFGVKDALMWNTGDEHNEFGHIDEDPENRVRMMEKRHGKLGLAAKEIPREEMVTLHGPPDADATVVSWGSTKGAILDALASLAQDGVSLNFLQIRMVLPFPTEVVTEILSKAKRKILVEMNYSAQMAGVIAEHTRITMDTEIVKFNGRPVTQNELYDALKGAAAAGAPSRMVLTNGS